MFGARVRARRPILLLLVLGLFLVIVGITATAQAIIVSTTQSRSILESVVGDDAATIRSLADVILKPDDLVPGSTDATRAAAIRQGLDALVDPPDGILRVEVRLPDGTVLWASDPNIIGAKASPNPAFTQALAATAKADFVDGASSEAVGDGWTRRPSCASTSRSRVATASWRWWACGVTARRSWSGSIPSGPMSSP